jgi:hypothetical protein
MRHRRLVFLAALALAAVVRAQPQAPELTLVRAGRVLDVRSGVYRADQGLWIEGGRIRPQPTGRLDGFNSEF